MSKCSEIFTITGLSHDFSGVCRRQQKACFINDCLPGEQVQALPKEQKRKYERWSLQQIEQAHAQRIEPACQYYQDCGGCNLQYAELELQQELKAEKLAEQLLRAGSPAALNTLPVLAGEGWHYRRKARLATWFNKTKKYYQCGFRAAGEKRLIAIESCLTLEQPLNNLLKPLQTLLQAMGGDYRLGHIDLLLADYLQNDEQAFVIMRINGVGKEQLQPDFLLKLEILEQEYDCALALHLDAGFYPLAKVQKHSLRYSLPEYQLELGFAFTDFIQANRRLNQSMVALVLQQLAPAADESIVEFFAGMGNFSLAIAQQAKAVGCYEGSEVLIGQLQANAKNNQLYNIQAEVMNLMADDLNLEVILNDVDKILLDPPRDGAQAVCQQLLHKGKKARVQKIVYVSCNPSSLARDAAILTAKAYQLTHLGLIDLFPQTRHIEAIAVFDAKK